MAQPRPSAELQHADSAHRRKWVSLANSIYVSPLWCVQYQRLLWLARQARTPGTTRTLVQAVLECRDPPPSTGPVGRAPQAACKLGWQRRDGWWHWDVPGQLTALHLVQADEGNLRHRVRKSQRYRAFWELERRRPGTFGGLGGAVHQQACREGLQVASTEGERSILRGLLAGATWTAGTVAGHAILRSDRCPFCRGAPEMEPHILWDGPRWKSVRRAWMPWVLYEARALPALALPAAWPVCLRAAGVLPLALVGEGEDAHAGQLLYGLYGRYLALLSARRAAEEAARLGGDAASTVFVPARGRGLDL